MWGPDKAKGKLDELTGKAQQAVGKVTDNDADREAGEDQAFHGRAEQAAAEASDDLGNATRIRDDKTRR